MDTKRWKVIRRDDSESILQDLKALWDRKGVSGEFLKVELNSELGKYELFYYLGGGVDVDIKYILWGATTLLFHQDRAENLYQKMKALDERFTELMDSRPSVRSLELSAEMATLLEEKLSISEKLKVELENVKANEDPILSMIGEIEGLDLFDKELGISLF